MYIAAAETRNEVGRTQRAESLRSSQQRILSLIATDCSLEIILMSLAEVVQELFSPSICAVLTYDHRADCLMVGAAPGFSEDMVSMLNESPLAPDLNSFSTAAFLRKTVVVTDIATDERCGASREAALRSGYRSCWANPVMSAEGDLLGVIGVYHREARAPDTEEVIFINELSDLAGIAISHENAKLDMRLLSSALEQTDDAVMILDREGIIEYVNPAYERTTGYTSTDLIGKTLDFPNQELREPGFGAEFWDSINCGKAYRDVIVNCRRNGEQYYEEVTITSFKDKHNNLTHYVYTSKDITLHMETQQRLNYLAHHDPLTGLANRSLLFDRLNNALAQADRGNHMVAILYIDLDRFKTVNDSLGHQPGDRLLKTIADRFRHCVRDTDTVARLGGDEFVILLPSVRTVSDPAHVANNLIRSLQAPVILGGNQEMFATASIGITIYPIDAEDQETLLKNADLTMYRVKSKGGNGYEFYADYMTLQSDQNLDMENKLRHALARNEFSLHFQPRIDMRSKKMCAIEALLRWEQSEIGEVEPKDFIPVLEQTGMITAVGRWVLYNACRYARQLKNAGVEGIRISVNVSPRQLHENTFVVYVQETLEKFELDGSCLELEITENLFIENLTAVSSMLHALHAIGVYISIDDFGTCYSSMSYLKSIPIDILKIDRVLIRDILSNKDDKAIVSAIIAMAGALGYRTTAEGIETIEQQDLLVSMGSDELQGYYLCRPQCGADLDGWIASH